VATLSDWLASSRLAHNLSGSRRLWPVGFSRFSLHAALTIRLVAVVTTLHSERGLTEKPDRPSDPKDGPDGAHMGKIPYRQ
jgi:hypothetical protein